MGYMAAWTGHPSVEGGGRGDEEKRIGIGDRKR